MGHSLLCLGRPHELPGRSIERSGFDPGVPPRQSRALEIGRFMNQPELGHWTYATIGLANTTWSELGRPRVELLLASTVDAEVCGQILANLAFHLRSR